MMREHYRPPLPGWMAEDPIISHLYHTVDSPESEDGEYGGSGIPYSDMQPWITENSELFKASEAFPMSRLNDINSLSFLSYIGPSPDVQIFTEFNQKRFGHSLLVARTMEAMLIRNNAPSEMLRKGIVAGLLHDIATPAFGDAAKKIDPQNLHEETFWQKVLDEKAWDYLKAANITKEEMDAIIHNQGLLGQLLDIADRISYTMVDVKSLIGPQVLFSAPTDPELDYRDTLDKLMRQDANLGSIYRDVGIDFEKEEIYFTNPDRLRRFLDIRILLHKNFYLHPISQARDFRVGNLIKQYYDPDSDNKDFLTPDNLREMSDTDLFLFLSKHHPSFVDNPFEVMPQQTKDLFQWYPDGYPLFATMEELEAKKLQLAQDPNIEIIGSVQSKTFDPAVEYKVLSDKGEIVSFKEWDPECAERMQKTAVSGKGYLLFWKSKNDEAAGFIPKVD